jgi:hypothetical protein
LATWILSSPRRTRLFSFFSSNDCHPIPWPELLVL